MENILRTCNLAVIFSKIACNKKIYKEFEWFLLVWREGFRWLWGQNAIFEGLVAKVLCCRKFMWMGCCLFLGIRLSGLEKNYWVNWAEILKSGDLLISDSARIWAGFITLFSGLDMQVLDWAMRELGLDQGSLVAGLVLRTEFRLGWHGLDLIKWVRQDPTQSSLSSPNWSFPLYFSF